MKSNIIELLHATHQTFIKAGLGMMPLTHLEGKIAPDYMGIGTTMDEKMFSPEDLYALIRRQQEQSEGIEIHLKDIQNMHTRISTDVRSAFFADEVFLVVKAGEEEIQILLRLSTLFEYDENKWVAIHSHGSKPELIETEKDTWGIEEWKQKNEELQKLVEERTKELSTSLENLKATQAQLIQSEKLASLGELTAGIAHEIQNPLNFVNNFAEVSAEMLVEMDAELDKGDIHEAKAISADLQQNLSKINHHGQRASAIVKGMLEHSRTGDAMHRVSTDLNALADEYLRLAYHGLRARDSSFNAVMETHFYPDLPMVSVIPQDIGRVLLNLINNAFYAVHQRAVETLHATSLPYQPTVTVSTRKLENAIEISVQDNGNGIPETIKDKIFQPFFTTKPSGQGTGLGLSLAYDIVAKGHGGVLEVESTEGGGSAFTIKLSVV